MKKTRFIILPILGVIAAIFFGWSTIFAQTIDDLIAQASALGELPSGTVVQLTLTDQDLTSAIKDYLNKHDAETSQMIQQSIGVSLDVSDPKVVFEQDEILLSIWVGKGLVKVKISARGNVVWTGSKLEVNVTSVEVPIVSVDPATVNSYIQDPLQDYLEQIQQYYEIRSFSVQKGMALIEAVVK